MQQLKRIQIASDEWLEVVPMTQVAWNSQPDERLMAIINKNNFFGINLITSCCMRF
jgi:hypothetical protein